MFPDYRSQITRYTTNVCIRCYSEIDSPWTDIKQERDQAMRNAWPSQIDSSFVERSEDRLFYKSKYKQIDYHVGDY